VRKTREECLALLRSDLHSVEPGRKFVVDVFRPEDALGVARLYYAVYKEMFPVDHVYDPQELVRLNAGPDLHQVVGRTPSGDVVGLYALFRSPPGRRIMEAGSWIVHPAYRSSTLAMRMAREINLKAHERWGLDVVFGQTVCDHVITQKMGARFGSLYSALEIEAMPPRPEDQGGRNGRISLLDGFIVYRDRPHALYPPRLHDRELRALYAELGLRRDFSDDPGPQDTTTSALVRNMDLASLAKMTATRIGTDFDRRLNELLETFPDRHIYQIVLPLWGPGCTKAVETARAKGFFLGGVLPLWYDRDGLLLQKVAGEPDFSNIMLHAEKSENLLEMIIADRRSLPAGG